MAWISRKKILGPLLLAAAGGPFLALDDGWRPGWMNSLAQGQLPQWSASGSAGGPPTAALGSDFAQAPGVENPTQRNGLPGGAPAAEVRALQAGSFGDYIRFDLSPNHVFSTWDRVTTVLSDSNLEGLRVALVTGAQVDDLAGSLTYYFDKQHAVQRITFQGSTGDPRRLVQFITDTYGFQSQPTLDAGLYVSQWNGKPTSALRIFHAPVVRAEQAHTRYQVQLEINRPVVPYQFKLTPPQEQQLRDGHHSNRW
jgi:hypothetical protein